ncbi:MAG: asparagine synthase (glutamine-hydrolyzing) [Nitrospirae bacterium]|nr:asparagine synthase (glutamine-hydrolyzing) [Nitrospirota bacterium]MBF0535780.1 asparagine synthase (glutamine-hydrolyzing) [Nitrospirota bacterium]MBF0617679.1 asparagine synthase (glutamine-hydrolyzing) [Nitrospirota bacterium]
MCGICGVVSFDRACRNETLDQMTDILSHRGPDGRGTYTDDYAGLGHRRLSILDLSDAGRQPMCSESGKLWIVFNGEIYNFKQLRSILEAKGYRFKSNSDTEVVLNGYEYWGTEVFSKLDGFFALALWDKKQKKLVLARDCCGVKPLFLSCNSKFIVFSSELKGILASGLISKQRDYQSLSNYLSMFYVPGPNTILKDVKQVAAGTYMVFEPGREAIAVSYWSIINAKNLTLPKQPEQIYELIRDAAAKAVDSSLVADVPVSLLLSSGLDSSIMLSELKRLGRDDIETITVGFKETSYDESKIANRFATEMGFKHTSVIMPYGEAAEVLQHIIYYLDALNANPCIIPEYLYFKETSQRYKVTLMGSGNDELFAGYNTYIADNYRKYFGMLPYTIRKMIAAATRYIPVSDEKYSFDYLAQKFAAGSLYHKKKSHYFWRTIFSDEEKELLLRKDLVADSGLNTDSYDDTYGKLFDVAGLSFQEQALYADFHMFLIDNANMEVDQLSMALSLEARPPFLTKNFVELAFAIPYSLKLKGHKTKYCLREAYKGILPQYLLDRKKHGLVSPLNFLFNKSMTKYLDGYLLSDTMAEYFDLKFIKKLMENHLERKQNNSYKLFTLLCFSLWHQIFIDGLLI